MCVDNKNNADDMNEDIEGKKSKNVDLLIADLYFYAVAITYISHKKKM